MAPTLFILFLDCCLELARWQRVGTTELIPKRNNTFTRSDVSEVQAECHCDFADDIVVWASGPHRVGKVQSLLSGLNEVCQPLGLCINGKKTVAMNLSVAKGGRE